MDNSSFQEHLNGEHDSLLASIDLFRRLLPHPKKDASVHSGEEGRFIELALSQYLREKLPGGIGVGGGFVVDIRNQWNSRQIDILLYDAAKYAPYMRYGEAVVVPTQAVVAALSVKRNLYKRQLQAEIDSLTEIGSHTGGSGYPKPYLSLLAFDSDQSDVTKAKDDAFKALSDFYRPHIDLKKRKLLPSWNEMLDSIIVFDKFLVRGINISPGDKKQRKQSKYLWTGGDGTKRNVYIQQLLHGIHRAWYDPRRGNARIGELLTMPEGGMQQLGAIPFCVPDRPYRAKWSVAEEA